MDKSLAYIICYTIIYNTVLCQINFFVYKGYRSNSIAFETNIMTSLLHCSDYCSSVQGCASFNVNSVGNRVRCGFIRNGPGCVNNHTRDEEYDYVFVANVRSDYAVTLHKSTCGEYDFTYEEAQTHCEALGQSIATLEQLGSAWTNGMSVCSCGWLSNGNAHYPMNEAHEGCGYSIGVHMCSWQSTWNVFCSPIQN